MLSLVRGRVDGRFRLIIIILLILALWMNMCLSSTTPTIVCSSLDRLVRVEQIGCCPFDDSETEITVTSNAAAGGGWSIVQSISGGVYILLSLVSLIIAQHTCVNHGR